MSWYSKIYIGVREYRAKNPIRGWILTRCLNIMLFLQMLLFSGSFYVVIWHICTTFISSPVQATIYICVFCSFGFMAMWSLLATIFAPIARVHERFKVSKERSQQLKDCTPFEKGRYVVDKSSSEQKTKQTQILDEICTEMGVVQAECDSAGRSKYCYVCEIMKPDRTHHCFSCGFCVVHFDHHCPWINHCVSHSNYKKFILYVTYSTITVVIFLLMAIESLVRFFVRGQYSEDWVSLVPTLFIGGAFSVFGLDLRPKRIFTNYYPLGELVIYHFGLIFINETTCEQAKPAELKNDNKADYNVGTWDNVTQVFGWGLWLFPINTHIEDGMHFKIRYDDPANKLRYIRTEKNCSSSKQPRSPNIPATTSVSAPSATPVDPNKNMADVAKIPAVSPRNTLRETKLETAVTQNTIVF